jgi:type II secretory pathway pseudopilin PulG
VSAPRKQPLLPQGGFTIIETLMVLAAGGLMMLIVFQAIPTLQRNGRNNQRSQDVSAVLGAVSRFALNNSGNMAGPCGGGGSDPSCFDSTQVLGNTHLSYYFPDTNTPDVSVVIHPRDQSDPVPSNPDSIDKVAVYNRLHCKTDNSGDPTDHAAGFRDVVALYSLEGANDHRTKLCQEL